MNHLALWRPVLVVATCLVACGGGSGVRASNEFPPLNPDVPDPGIDVPSCDAADAPCGPCDDGDPCTVDRCECGTCVHEHVALQACDAPPCSPEGSCLWVVSRASLSPAEKVVALTLQGIVAKNRPGLWIDGAGWTGFITDLADRHHVTFRPAPAGVPALLSAFRPAIRGYVLYDLGQASQTVAAALAGPWRAVAIDASIEPMAMEAGLPLLLDARGRDAAWCLGQYAPLFAHDVLASPTKNDQFSGFLLDFAAARNAFVFHGGNDDFTTAAVAAAGGAPVVYGWGPDEHDLVMRVSKGGGGVVGGDWSSNLSTLSLVKEPVLKQPASPVDVPAVEDGTHYVAFVMSDGDNLHFLQNVLNTEPWYASPLRGTFPMTWEVTPAAAETTPSILQWYYAHATAVDTFIAPPSGIAYSYPCYNPSLDALVAHTATAMAAADLRIVTVMDDDEQMGAVDRYLDQPGIAGALYKDYAGYNDHKGAVRYRNGKAAMAYRYRIWQTGSAADTPKGVAKALNAAPANPRRDSASYSLVSIHAWSTWPDSPFGEGSMGAIAWTISLLQPHVRVVSAEEILGHLTRDLEGAGPLCGNGACDPGETCGGCGADCGPCIDFCTFSACSGTQTCDSCPEDCGPCKTTAPMRFEAETDLSHDFGHLDGDGWAATIDDPSSGYLVRGPPTTKVPGGWHTAGFLLAIDAPDATDNPVVAKLDVYDGSAGKVLAHRDVTRHEFQAAGAFQPFPLVFDALAGHALEFRVQFTKKSWLSVDAVVVDG